MKSYIEQAVKLASSVIPFSTVKKWAGRDLIIPLYHCISDEDQPYIKNLYVYKNLKEFNKALDFFLQHYTPIGLASLLDNVRDGRRLPDNALLLTFDDGLRELYDIVAPILKSKGVPATFFLTTAWLDNRALFYKHKVSLLIEAYQNSSESSLEKIQSVFLKNGIYSSDIKSSILSVEYWQKHILDEISSILNVDFDDFLKRDKPYLDSVQVKSLINDGFHIGAHSVDHPPYSLLPFEEQLWQTRESIRFIKEKFSVDYGAFAFPYNDQGVSHKFFEAILGNGGVVDVSFGTSSLMNDTYPNSFQRSVMETIPMTAKNMISVRYAVKIMRSIFGKNEIRRT